jgi:hypothetical protein
LLVATAHAQPTPAQPEPTTNEEAQRAQLAGQSQASAAAEGREQSEEEEEHVPGLLDDADHPERSAAHETHRTVVTADVFPETHPQTVPAEPDPEEEELVLPPWDPEWRLRLGIGATIASGGSAIVSFRLVQELEWMPHDVAPILFAITGGEVLIGYTMGLAGARAGLYGVFCQDRVVTCTGAVALRLGVITGNAGTAFDIGGDGDARFRFDGVELTVRVGFFDIQSTAFIDAVGMVGAAF